MNFLYITNPIFSDPESKLTFLFIPNKCFSKICDDLVNYFAYNKIHFEILLQENWWIDFFLAVSAIKR